MNKHLTENSQKTHPFNKVRPVRCSLSPGGRRSLVFGVVPNLSGVERVFNKGEIQEKDSPNAELPRDLGGNDGLGPPTPLNAPSIPRNDKLGLPHPAHKKVDFIRGWTTRCVLDILNAVVQRRIYRPKYWQIHQGPSEHSTEILKHTSPPHPQLAPFRPRLGIKIPSLEDRRACSCSR